MHMEGAELQEFAVISCRIEEMLKGVCETKWDYSLLPFVLWGYASLPSDVASDCPTFWLQPAKGLIKNMDWMCHIMWMVICPLNNLLKHSSNVIFWRGFLMLGKLWNLESGKVLPKDVMSVQFQDKGNCSLMQ